MVVDPNAMVNIGIEIPEDPVAISTSHGTNVAGNMLLETSIGGALRVLDTTLHRRITGGQVPPGVQQRLLVGTTPLPTAQTSRDELPQNSNRSATLSRPQPSLGSDVFSTLDANVQGVHLILRSLSELDPANPLTPMVN